ncbi:MAG: glycerophosphodiester phosphodiesterase family protein [Acutalibacteraceae bacterium]|nr:glycerophosphodiester phosphodiesterase family protein [Acutalibacteraceae bacterium]
MLYIVLTIIILMLLFLFLIFPSTRRHKDRMILENLYIAHRGLHCLERGIPENSLKAFEEAINEGYAIELDIHLTKDGQVVVFHDDDGKRMCGDNRKICEMTLSEIKELRLADTNFTIPTLKECLDLIDGKVPLMIEIKYDGNSSLLCSKTNEILLQYTGKYFIQSFYPQNLYWYRRHRKDICRGQLSCAFKGDTFIKRLSGCLLFNFISRPDFVSYDYRDKNHICRRLATILGAFPVGWTFTKNTALQINKKFFKTYIFENFKPKK